MRLTRTAIVAVVIVLVCATLGAAQVNWMSPLKKPGFAMEITKVDFSGSMDFTFFTNQYNLSARFAFAKNVFGLVELPYTHISFKESWYDGYYPPHIYAMSESTVGNPYLGAELGGHTTGPLLRFGIRLPLADVKKDFATEFGMGAAFDKWESFYPECFSVSTAFGYVAASSEYYASFAVGPTVLSPKGADEREVLAELGAELWGEGRVVKAGIGYHLRYLCTEKSWSFDRCMEHQFAISTIANIGSIHPGLHFRFPLDKNINYGIKMAYGLNLTVDLPGSSSTGTDE